MSETLSDKVVTKLTGVEIIILFILCAILAQFYLRVFENLLFSTLMLPDTSWWVALVLSILVTILVLIITFNYPVLEKGVI